MKQPSLGRVVHFVDEYGKEFAALIVRVWSEQTVNLFVFPNGDPISGHGHVETSIVFDEGHKKPSWHWPGYVPDK